jgi:prepilin-type processing-associated H-X9-DG protein
MKTLEIGLHFYHDSQRHYPSVYTCGKDGKPLFSWIVPLLPKMEYDTVFDALKLDEPWNSPHNAKILSGFYIGEFLCPSVDRTNNNIYSSYVAVIGPGTIWRKEGTVKLSDLPHKGSQTVAVVEVADSGKHHWAEPFAVTVNEVLENMRTGKGVRISSFHPAGVHILFADGSVRCLPCKMPLLLWRKILEGELLAEDLDAIKSRIHSNASDMVDVYVGPTERSSTTIPGVIVWLVSIVLLFYRAVKSRKPNIEPTPLAS